MRGASLLIPALCVMLFIAVPAAAQLTGNDTAPGSSCAGFPEGATRVTADADLDGAQVVLICDGTTWSTMGVKVQFDSADCDSGKDGTIRYSSAGDPQWEYCDGGAETWRPFEHAAAGGACVAPALCPNVGDVCDDDNPATTDDPVFAGFIIDPAVGSECRSLFVAPAHQGFDLQWSVADGVDHIADDSMWDGRINDAQIPDSTNFPAAKACKDLVSGGFDDWYLPAKEELSAIAYSRDIIAASTEGWGWNTVTSSEFDEDSIWLQHLNVSQPGHTAPYGKTDSIYSVRCVRTESAAPVQPCADDTSGTCHLAADRGSGDPEFLAANIADGVNILGVTGTFAGGDIASCVARVDCSEIGDVCSDGSVFAGFRVRENGRCQALFAADTDQADAAFSTVTADTGADDYFDGAVNQSWIEQNATLPQYPAFQSCGNLNRHGHADWYVPAPVEMYSMMLNWSALGLEEFSWYMTATEFDNAESYVATPFGIGYFSKSDTRALRCVRAEPAEPVALCADDDLGTCLLDAARANTDPEFLAANIADGVNILGVTGTFEGSGGTTINTLGSCVGPLLCPNTGDVCDDQDAGTVDDPIFAGFMVDQATGRCDTLFVSNEDQSTSAQWRQSGSGDEISNDSTDDGRINDAQIADSTTFPAFKLCKDLTDGGFDDWYLPARDELHLLYRNRTAINANAAGNFTSEEYWSSTEEGGGAWIEEFGSGDNVTNTKTASNDVRCVIRRTGSDFPTGCFAGWNTQIIDADWLTIAGSSDLTTMIAGVDFVPGAHVSNSGGASWTQLTGPNTPIDSNNGSAASADGSVLAVTSWGGQIHISTDGGTSWAVRGSARDWNSIAMSANGTQMVATVNGGYIYTSDDTGLNWTERTSSGSRSWRSVASSADGEVLVAAARYENIYVSTDGGATWNARGPSADWHHAAISADGERMVVAEDNVDHGIYTSFDSGLNWTDRTPIAAVPKALAMSTDGLTVAVAYEDELYLSNDSGANWQPRSLPDNSIVDLVLSADGTKIVAVTNFWWTDGGATDDRILTSTCQSGL